MRNRLRKLGRRAQTKPETAEAPSSSVTDQTLERHRKEIFSRGRRFVYPIHITKRHIVRNSILVSLFFIVVFLGSMAAAIYRYKSDSELVYRISKVIPFPVASVNGDWVSYKDYLFILRSNQTYLESQGHTDEGDPESTARIKHEALAEAKRNALLKQISGQRKITVSTDEIDEQIALLESFASGERRLSDIVREFYGIDISDLRSLLRVQLLKQKLTPLVSEAARSKIDEIQTKSRSGEDFTALAVQFSDDEQTSAAGGSLGIVTSGSAELDEHLVNAGLALEVGAVSEVIETKAGFHLVKKISQKTENSAELAHILIRYDDIDQYLEEQLKLAAVKDFVRL